MLNKGLENALKKTNNEVIRVILKEVPTLFYEYRQSNTKLEFSESV